MRNHWRQSWCHSFHRSSLVCNWSCGSSYMWLWWVINLYLCHPDLVWPASLSPDLHTLKPCSEVMDNSPHLGLYANSYLLTLPMLRLLLSKAQGCKDIWKPPKPCHVRIHLKALAEYSQMSTHMPGGSHVSAFLRHFVLTKSATSSISVKLHPHL